MFFDIHIQIVFCILFSIIGLTPIFNLFQLDKPNVTGTQIIQTTFNGFTICFLLLTVTMISTILKLKFNIGDIFVTRTKSILFFQITITNIFKQTVFWICWMISIISSLFLSGFGEFILENNVHIFLLSILILLLMIFWSQLIDCMWILLKNRLMAFVSVSLINILLFYLSTVHIEKLFYYFASPGSIIETSSKMMTLAIIIFWTSFYLWKLIKNKDFI